MTLSSTIESDVQRNKKIIVIVKVYQTLWIRVWFVI